MHRNLHAKVTTCNHNSIRLVYDVRKIIKAFLVLDLGYYRNMLSRVTEYLADVLDLRSFAYEGGCDKINFVFDAPLKNIIFVLLSYCRQVHNNTGKVHVLPFTELCVVFYTNLHRCRASITAHHSKCDGTIRREDFATWLDVLSEARIGYCNHCSITFDTIVGS